MKLVKYLRHLSVDYLRGGAAIIFWISNPETCYYAYEYKFTYLSHTFYLLSRYKRYCVNVRLFLLCLILRKFCLFYFWIGNFPLFGIDYCLQRRANHLKKNITIIFSINLIFHAVIIMLVVNLLLPHETASVKKSGRWCSLLVNSPHSNLTL